MVESGRDSRPMSLGMCLTRCPRPHLSVCRLFVDNVSDMWIVIQSRQCLIRLRLQLACNREIWPDCSSCYLW